MFHLLGKRLFVLSSGAQQGVSKYEGALAAFFRIKLKRLLLPRCDNKGQPVFGRGQRASRKGREGAGRAVGEIEIEGDFAVDRNRCFQETPCPISFLAAATVTKNEENFAVTD